MIKLVKTQKEANCITHCGTIHADEVFATAFLELYKKDIKVIRVTRVDKNISKDTIVYDIGRGKFDHHQEDVETRENGIKYSSIGLLWKEFGKDYLKNKNIEDIDEVFKLIDKELIEGIDAIDNGIFPIIEANYKVKTISDIIRAYNPSFYTEQEENKQFLKAEKLAKEILSETVYNVVGRVKGKKEVNKLIDKNEELYLELDKYLPYEDAILTNPKGNNIMFVVYPSNREGYAIKTVPKSLEDHTDRLLLPEKWAGLAHKKLEDITGVKGAIFCHNNRFIATAETREAALKLVKEALK
ncbi:MAG: MYG1 family protein [Bacilli bacterium]|nr:MYG1 family protein [Bacilli bacterium]MBR3049220.1 MYG1 family protein [Bacilli bacterium]